MTGIIAVLVFLVLLFLGVPIAFVIGWVSILGIYFIDILYPVGCTAFPACGKFDERRKNLRYADKNVYRARRTF